jgi:hypothetical protein
LANRNGDEIVLSQTDVSIDPLAVPVGEAEQSVG